MNTKEDVRRIRLIAETFLLGLYARAAGRAHLNAAIPWELEFRGGVAQLNADLDRLPLRAIDVLGGASRVMVTLPRPAGTIYIYVAGGASDMAFYRPAGVGVRVRVGNGASNVTIATW